ncbi:MAG: hypothetical protein M3435_03300, partial [Actinomycetota bacterium]|nr:hypothetical protein [Actinomycetota bacterium]
MSTDESRDEELALETIAAAAEAGITRLRLPGLGGRSLSRSATGRRAARRLRMCAALRLDRSLALRAADARPSKAAAELGRVGRQ